MKLRNLVFLGLMVTLASCFLKQQSPENTQNPGTSAAVDGLISLQDIDGDGRMSGVMAAFALQSAGKSIKDALNNTGTDLPTLGITLPKDLTATRAEEACQVRRRPRGEIEGGRASRLVSAGAITFGPDLQSTLVPVDEDGDHRYFKKLDGPLPAGGYQVKVGGSNYVQRFSARFSLPEEMRDVQVVPSSNEEEPADEIVIRKDGKVTISWRGPALPNDQNIALSEIYTDTANETIWIQCIAMEKRVASERGTFAWTIPTKLLSQLATTNEAQVFVSRAHVNEAQGGSLVVGFQGIRSFLLNARVE